MKTRVLAAVLLISMSMQIPIAQAQLSLLPGDSNVVSAAADQSAPDIAGGTGVSLVVWTDNRPNPYDSYMWSEYETSRDIYGVRIDSSGNVLDPVPLAIVSARSNQRNPKVVWNGSNWLVVFESMDVGGTGYYEESLEAVRVAPSGQLLDPKPIKLYGLIPSGPSYWSLASDGNHWVVVNQATSTSSDIVAVRISSDGVALDPPTRAIVPATYFMRSNIKLAYGGGVFALTYTDNYDTKLLRFDSNLTPLSAAPQSLLNAMINDMAGNSDGFYIVWNRQEPDWTVRVVGSRVNSAGVRLDGNGVNISGTKQPDGYAINAVTWDGVNWRVTWAEPAMTYVARVSSAGALLDSGSVAVPGVQTGPTAGNGAGGINLVWTVLGAGNLNDVLGAHITPANTPGAAQTLSVGAPLQFKPGVAAGADGYMMVYRSITAVNCRVLAQPLNENGDPLTPEPVQLELGASVNGPGSPNVAWNGSHYLVSWGAAGGIVGQRLAQDGTKIDAAPFMVMTNCFGPADVAALGGDFLVTGRKYGFNVQYINPVAARVSGTGAVLDAPMVLGSSYLRTAPAVVSLGGRWLIAWHSNATHDNPSARSMGAFVDAGGVSTPEFQIHGPFSTSGGNGIFEVGLASSGDEALFVQSQELTSGVETDLMCRVIDAAGAVGPQINLTPWVGNQYRPRAAWDGTNFVVVYQDQKNRLALHTLDQFDSRSDLFAMRVSPSGAIVDPQGFVFSALSTAETDPTVAAVNGALLMAAAIMMNDAANANYRIAYELVPAGGPSAAIQASVTEGDVPLQVTFGSAGSTGVSYSWDFGDSGSSTLANPSHTFTAPGEYLVTLTVIDGVGRQSVQKQMINATAVNQVPVAMATANVYTGNVPFDVVFYAAQSYDPDGFIGNVEWLFPGGWSYWGATAYHTFYEPGPQTVTLNCYDARGGVGTTTLIINDTGANLPPIVHASASTTSGPPPLTVQFSSAGSSDPDGTIAAYLWNFGDNETSNEANPEHTYTHSGSFVATLTVTDNDNESRSDSLTIDVLVMHHVEYGVNLSLGPTHYIEHYEQGEQAVGEIFEEDIIADYGRVAGTANVGFGVNKARVDLAGMNPNNPFFFEYGFATSRYWDMFQLDDPELDGTHGFFDVTLYVAGTGHVDMSDGYLQSPDTEFDAFWHAVINVSVDGVTDPNGSPIQSVFYWGEWYKGLESTTLDYYGDALNTYQQTATIEFVYGQPIFMDSFLQVDTRFDNQISSVPGTLDTVIDLGNSSYWGGIRNLRDAQGNAVTTATYSSSSGFDYRQDAVPGTVLPAMGRGDGGIARVRSLSMLSQAQGSPGALRVTLNALHHVDPPYTGGVATDFSELEGQVRWVGPPTEYVESGAGGEPFFAAQLQCTPHYRDWSTIGTLHVFGSAILPSSAYRIDTLGMSCQGTELNCTFISEPFELGTGRWGDVAELFSPPDDSVQPDIADISELVDKFRAAPGAVIKARGLLAGEPGNAFGEITHNVLNVDFGFSHISACVDAFRGMPYPYTIRSCP